MQSYNGWPVFVNANYLLMIPVEIKTYTNLWEYGFVMKMIGYVFHNNFAMLFSFYSNFYPI